MDKRIFFHDILKDKGSTKFSITKSLALLFSIFLITYLAYISLIKQVEVDHTLVIELIGLIAGLVGLKNNWGVSKTDKSGSKEVTGMNLPINTPSKEDEGFF